MEQCIPQMSYTERDFDRLFIEEACFSEAFFDAFCRKIGLSPQPIRAIMHSVEEHFGGDAWGETDIFVELENAGGLLIENKLSAVFQPYQAERYRARAQHHSRNGAEFTTVLIAPDVYLENVDKEAWDRVCSYSDIADCIVQDDARSKWRQDILLGAGMRAARVLNLAKSASARKMASSELLAFKDSWRKWIGNRHEWTANEQRGATDEFLYAPRRNPFKLRVWHHPLAGYLSVQNLDKYPGAGQRLLEEKLPVGFVLKQHPNSVYLDAATPVIDMSASFSDELENVEEGMRIARLALDLAEAAIGYLSSAK